MIKPLQSITLKNDNGEDTTYVVASAPAIVETTEPASVASFSDGAEGIPVKSLIADINPVQNLNGQSAPYPAGGGKNKLPSPTSTTKTHNGITISVANGVYSINGTASALSEIIFDLPTDVTIDNTMKCAFLNDFANSNVVVYWRYNNTNGASQGMNSTNYVKEYDTSGTLNKVRFLISSGTAISGTVHLSPVLIPKSETNPTAYIPYSNICPITGWTGMNVVRTGKNLFDKTKYYTLKTDYDYIDGEYYCKAIHLKPNTQVVVSFTAAATSSTILLINNKRHVNDTGFFDFRKSTDTKTYTTDEDGNLYIGLYSGSTEAAAHTRLDECDTLIRLYLASSTYEPYNGTTYPISWADEAGTVYGGTLDVTTGLLTVTHGSDVYNGTTSPVVSVGVSSLTGNYYAIVNLTRASRATYGTNVGGAISNMLAEGITPTAQGKFSLIGSSMNATQAALVLPDQTITTKSAFDTYLQSNPITLVYPLITPQTYQLTPQAVTTILGQNNIWADTGDVEVAYCADTKMYIDKVIAAL